MSSRLPADIQALFQLRHDQRRRWYSLYKERPSPADEALIYQQKLAFQRYMRVKERIIGYEHNSINYYPGSQCQVTGLHLQSSL